MLFLVAFAWALGDEPTTWTGTLEPRWWATPPGFGERPSDGTFSALTLRFDTPQHGMAYVLYSAGAADQLEVDQTAAGCIGGRVTVQAELVRGDSAWGGGTLTHARVVSCTPAESMTPVFGQSVTLTGTLRRWWWFMAPGFGATPATDKLGFGSALVVDGRAIPLFPPGAESDSERHRRFAVACDGQEVTLTGRWEPSKNPRVTPTYKLMDVAYAKPCAAPGFFVAFDLAARPAAAGWLD